jgi:hypothetical protein
MLKNSIFFSHLGDKKPELPNHLLPLAGRSVLSLVCTIAFDCADCQLWFLLSVFASPQAAKGAHNIRSEFRRKSFFKIFLDVFVPVKSGFYTIRQNLSEKMFLA